MCEIICSFPGTLAIIAIFVGSSGPPAATTGPVLSSMLKVDEIKCKVEEGEGPKCKIECKTPPYHPPGRVSHTDTLLRIFGG